MSVSKQIISTCSRCPRRSCDQTENTVRVDLTNRIALQTYCHEWDPLDDPNVVACVFCVVGLSSHAGWGVVRVIPSFAHIRFRFVHTATQLLFSFALWNPPYPLFNGRVCDRGERRTGRKCEYFMFDLSGIIVLTHLHYPRTRTPPAKVNMNICGCLTFTELILFIFIVFGPVFLGLARSVCEYMSLGVKKPHIFIEASFKNRKTLNFP